MKVRTLATIETISSIIINLIRFPFCLLYMLVKLFTDLLGSIDRKFGHWLLKRSSEYKDGVLEKNGLEDTGYLTAYGLKKAVENGLAKE